MNTDTVDKERGSLPYVSAGTFITTLDHIRTVGSPNILDRNALPPSFSGSSKYDTLHALRFFKLIDKEGRPDGAALNRLVQEDTRKEALSEILRREYAELIALPLSTAGPTEVQRWFAENASPSTASKAKAFFIALAKSVGLQMHSLVANSARASSGSIRRKRKKITVKPDANGAVGSAASDKAPPMEQARLNLPLPPAVKAYIEEMPPAEQGWSEADFTEWLGILELSIRRAYKLPKKKGSPE